MDKRELEDLILVGLSTREIAKNFSKSQITIRYWLKKYSLKTKRAIYNEGSEQLKKERQELRSKKATIATTKRRRKLKELALEYKGGCCTRCGYNKCKRALQFHHVNPEEKDFAVSTEGSTRSWEKLKIELDKCILVCANCHAEIHEEIYNQSVAG